MCVFVEDVWSSKIIVLRKGMRCQKTKKKNSLAEIEKIKAAENIALSIHV